MKFILTIVLIYFILSAQAQDSVLHKYSIDSTLSLRSNKTVKKRKHIVNGIVTFYYYDRNTDQITDIFIHHRQSNDEARPWIYTYNFLNSQLVRISKWNGFPLKHTKRQIAEYYFKDEKVFFRKEAGTLIPDIYDEIEKGKTLAINSTKF
jgi:hypothetical protein